MTYFVKVYVTYKGSVLDPQGEAVKKTVHRMGHETIEDTRTGKYLKIQLADTGKPIDIVIETTCDKLLANVNMEIYRCEVKKVGEV